MLFRKVFTVLFLGFATMAMADDPSCLNLEGLIQKALAAQAKGDTLKLDLLNVEYPGKSTPSAQWWQENRSSLQTPGFFHPESYQNGLTVKQDGCRTVRFGDKAVFNILRHSSTLLELELDREAMFELMVKNLAADLEAEGAKARAELLKNGGPTEIELKPLPNESQDEFSKRVEKTLGDTVKKVLLANTKSRKALIEGLTEELRRNKAEVIRQINPYTIEVETLRDNSLQLHSKRTLGSEATGLHTLELTEWLRWGRDLPAAEKSDSAAAFELKIKK